MATIVTIDGITTIQLENEYECRVINLSAALHVVNKSDKFFLHQDPKKPMTLSDLEDWRKRIILKAAMYKELDDRNRAKMKKKS